MESETSLDMTAPAEETAAAGPIATPGPQTGAAEQTDEAEIRNETHTVKYNGELRELTLEELKTAAQKGLNYDKVAAERDRLRAAREFGVLDRMAGREGITREALLDRLEQSETVPPAGGRAPSGEDGAAGRLSAFRALYPDVVRLPEEVVADIGRGEDIVVAYQKHEIRELKRELAAQEQNAKNRERSVGSLSDTGSEGNRYYSERELDSLQKNGGKRLLDDAVWEKAVKSMIFHQKNKKG